MTTRQDVLKQIVTLAASHKISVREFSDAMRAYEDNKISYGPVRKLFAYLSGICLFSGIAAYINMFWHEMNSYERVIITLGAGFSLYIMALVSLTDPRYRRAVSPMFQMAAVLQTTGLFVVIYEWDMIADPRYISLFVFCIMFIQQSLTFYATRNSTLLFFSLAFGSLFFSNSFELLGMDASLNGLIIGISLLSLAYGIHKVYHTSQVSFWYLCASVLLLGFSFDLLRDTPFEVFYLGITCFMVYLSVVSHSRVLMTTSVGAMLAYISYFTIAHFVDSIGWPITLLVLGLVFSGISAEAWKLNRRFIRF